MIGFDSRPPGSSVAIAKKGITRPMRFVARLCNSFVSRLAIGLAYSEIPELLSFGDDTSNDFAFSTRPKLVMQVADLKPSKSGGVYESGCQIF